jgi:RHS repeat-associated protein
MKQHTLRNYNRLSTWFLIVTMLCSTTALYGVNVGHGNSGDSNSPGNDSGEFKPEKEKKGEKPGDHDSGNCSVVYRMNLGSFQSEHNQAPVNLSIKRLHPTPAMFTPQSLEVDSLFGGTALEFPEAQQSKNFTAAQVSLASAESLLQSSETNLQQKESELASAIANRIAAADHLQATEAALAADPENPALQADYDAALAAYNNALAAESAASSAKNSAQNTFNSAQNNYNTASSNFTTAEQAFNDFMDTQASAGTLLRNAQQRVIDRIGLVRPNGYGIDYAPNPATGLWAPVGAHSGFSMRVVAAASGEAFSRIDGAGNAMQFSNAPGAIPSFVSATGRVLEVASPGVRHQVIRRENAVRQVLTPQTLTDVIVLGDFGFETRLYNIDQKGSVNAEGLFQPVGSPFALFRVENPTGDVNRTDRVRITTIREGVTHVDEWQYSLGANDWTLVSGTGDEATRVLKTVQEIGNHELHQWTVMDANDHVVATRREKIQKFAWGKWMTEQVLDPEGAALTFTRDYYTNANDSGSYAKVREEVNHDGSWKHWQYDSLGRESIVTESWLDLAPGSSPAAAKATYYDYTPVDQADTAMDYDLRPRTVTVKIEDNTTAITYHAYTIVNGGHVEITEQVVDLSNPYYGNPTNLRHVKEHYPVSEDEATSGRLHREIHPDGRMDTYTYERHADNSFATTVTHGFVDAPDGVAYQSTRETTLLDPQGNEVSKSIYVYTGSGYELLESIAQTFTPRGDLTERAINGRIVYSAEYANALITSETDEQGVTTLFEYDSHDRVKTSTKVGVAGQPNIVTTFVYDAADRIVEKHIAGGDLLLTETWEYDLAGRMTDHRDVNGYLTTYLYENDGRKVTRTNPDGSTVVTESFRDGQRKSVTGSGAVNVYYTHAAHADGTLTTTRNYSDPESPRWHESVFDGLGRLLAETQPGFDNTSFVKSYHYNNEGRLAKMTETGKADTLYVYNAARQLYRTGLDLSANGTLDPASNDRITESARYFEQDGAGHWWSVSVEKIYATAASANATQLSERRRRVSGHPTGLASEIITLDINGNAKSERTHIDRYNSTVSILTAFADSSLEASQTFVNGLLLTKSTGSVDEPILYTYDALGRPASETHPHHHDAPSIIAYVPSSNLILSETDPAGNTTTYSYHPDGQPGAGRIAVITNALNQKTYRSYSPRGELTHTWGDTDYPVQYAYNAYGERIAMTTYRTGDDDNLWTTSTWPSPTPAGDTTTWIYDEPTGLLTRKQYADAEGTDYTYTTAGQLHTRTWARGIVTTYGYDTQTGELTDVTYSDSTPNLAFTYNRLGQQATITDATGTRSFEYRADLQLEKEILSTFYDQRQISRTYQSGTPGTDVVGRYTGLTVGSSGNPSSDYTASYGFDAYGRLDSVSDGNNTFAYGYLADSNLIETMTSPVHTTTYTYEDERDLRKVVDNVVSSTSVSKYSYQHDELGRRTSRVQQGTAFTQATFDAFDYNDRGEVIESKRYAGTDPENPGTQITPATFAYDFDPIGNRLSSQIGADSQRNYTSNALNQYTQVSGFSSQPSHDEDGNLTESGTGWFYKWDAENRLIEAQNYQFTPDTGSKRLYFIYDYQSRRVAKIVEEWNGATWVETSDHRYLYDGWNLIFQISNLPSAIETTKSFLWGLDLSQTIQGAGGVGGLLSVTEHAGTHQGTYVYTYDANGNVGQVLNSTGATVAHYEYDPFGNIINQTGTYADANTFSFSTKYFDVETGLYYYGYRYLDPQTGRWLNRDPIEEAGGLNLYGFVDNNGVNFIDLYGLSLWCSIKKYYKRVTGAIEESTTIEGGMSGGGKLKFKAGPIRGEFGVSGGWSSGGNLSGTSTGSITEGSIGGSISYGKHSVGLQYGGYSGFVENNGSTIRVEGTKTVPGYSFDAGSGQINASNSSIGIGGTMGAFGFNVSFDPVRFWNAL